MDVDASKQDTYEKDLDGSGHVHGRCDCRCQVEQDSDSASEFRSERAGDHKV